MKGKFNCLLFAGTVLTLSSLVSTASAEVKIASQAVMGTDPMPTNMLHVVDDADPVRFEGLQEVAGGTSGEFVFVGDDGVLKKAGIKVPALVHYSQSESIQTYTKESFGAQSLALDNHNVLNWDANDRVYNNDGYISYDYAANTYTVLVDGNYKITGHANYLFNENASVGNMNDEVHVVVAAFKQSPGSTTWVPSVGNRCAYSHEWETLTSSCVYNGVDFLTAGTKIRIDLFRGIGYVFTGDTPQLTSSGTANGITATRSVELTFYPND